MEEMKDKLKWNQATVTTVMVKYSGGGKMIDTKSINMEVGTKKYMQSDRVQDSNEEQDFWMTRLYWVGIRLNQFEIFEEHENCL